MALLYLNNCTDGMSYYEMFLIMDCLMICAQIELRFLSFASGAAAVGPRALPLDHRHYYICV
jgi:hypothetical protein